VEGFPQGFTGEVREKSWSEWQPKFTWRYKPQENLSYYASYSRGFRSGGFNQTGVGPVAASNGFLGVGDTFDAEVVDTIEAGVKGQFMDGRVRTNLSVYRSEAEGTYFFIFLAALGGFVASLSGRLSAMAAAHDLLSEMHWRGADLGELVAKQLAHYLSGSDKRLRMQGPAVRLPQQFAVPLALALHELATNAAKHGSLSTPEGRVDLSWTYARGPRDKLRLEWRESGGSPVSRSDDRTGARDT